MAVSSRKTAFAQAVSYALSKVGKPEMVLKNEQLTAIQHVYNGNDVFVWLPMGYGKSICYEVLPFIFDHKRGRTEGSSVNSVVVVISPLVSLMINQVSALREQEVSAAIISGNEGVDKELQATEKDLAKYKLLFSAPEAILGTDRWKEMLLKPPLYDEIVAVAIDEAHCVSKW